MQKLLPETEEEEENAQKETENSYGCPTKRTRKPMGLNSRKEGELTRARRSIIEGKGRRPLRRERVTIWVILFGARIATVGGKKTGRKTPGVAERTG